MWTQNISLAQKLISRSSSAKLHLQVFDGKVSIVDPDAFSAEISVTKTTLLQDNVNAVIANLARLWVPIGRKFILAAVAIGKEIIRQEPQKTLALGTAWQATFDAKPF